MTSRACRCCGDPVVGQPPWHHTCSRCWRQQRPSARSKLASMAGQLTIFDLEPEPEPERSAFLDWLDSEAAA